MITVPPWMVSMLGCSLIIIHTQKGPIMVSNRKNKLKPNGFIHIATDWQPYADWIKPRFDANPKFTGGIVPRPNWRVLSKFEGQGLKKGHVVTDFRYEKL